MSPDESPSPATWSSSSASDGHIPGQLRLLLEVVARACKRISHAVNKGALGDVLGTAGSENVQGEMQKKLDIIANEVLIEANEWGGHLAGHGHRGDGRHLRGAQPLPARASTCCCSTRSTALSNIDVNVSIGTIFSVLQHARGRPRRRRGRLPAARQPAGRRRLLRLRPADHAGADRGRRRGHVHARPRAGLLRADPGRRAHPRGHEGVRHQHEQHAPLGRPGEALHRRVPGRQGRPARQGLQHALGRLAWWPTCTAS